MIRRSTVPAVRKETGWGQLLFQQAAGYQAPQWPTPAHPQKLHLEVSVDDIEAAEAQVLALGASRLPGEGGNCGCALTLRGTRSAWCSPRVDARGQAHRGLSGPVMVSLTTCCGLPADASICA